MIWILPLALLSGLFGRMGGAGKSGQWYDCLLDTKWRDIGCSLIVVLTCYIFLGWHPWVYLAVFGLHWATFSTYWDKLFGYDNLWFSGFMVGVALFPVLFIDSNLLWFVSLRALFLMIVWGCLNKYLAPKILVWNRDVVEECSRYFVSL
jgi:hypothetical protein